MITKMGMPWVTVKDMKAAKKLYVETLGFKISEENADCNWLEVKCGDSLLGIWQEEPNSLDKAGQNAVLTFNVDDIETTREMLEKKGVHFVGEMIEMPGVFKMATFVDSSNNKLQLYQQL